MNKHVLYVPHHLAVPARAIALDHAGGCTLSPGHEGYWRDSTGKLHIDHITLMTVFEQDVAAREAITGLLFAAGELSVAYETNGVPHLVDAGSTAEVPE